MPVRSLWFVAQSGRAYGTMLACTQLGSSSQKLSAADESRSRPSAADAIWKIMHADL